MPQEKPSTGARLEGAAIPAPIRFEDFHPGVRIDLGTWRMTAEEIIGFATDFDPQPMHLDPEAGAASLLGGLAASGWHSCCVLSRMIADSFLRNAALVHCDGVDRTRWRRPVLAGDVLHGQTEILSARHSRSRPSCGWVRMAHRGINQRGELAIEMTGSALFRRRETPS